MVPPPGGGVTGIIVPPGGGVTGIGAMGMGVTGTGDTDSLELDSLLLSSDELASSIAICSGVINGILTLSLKPKSYAPAFS